MQMTPANARYHLKILADQGAVVQSGERLSAGQRGRPERIYRLADTDHNLDLLASLLLQRLQLSASPDEMDSTLRSVAVGLAGELAGETLQHSLGPRLVQAVQHLSRLRYQARWEARPSAPEIYFGHCPYQKIITAHPELCRMDAFLLQQVTGHPVDQLAKLTVDRFGGIYCRFVLRTP